MAEQATGKEPLAESAEKHKKSAIKFPYYDLEAAVDLARTIHRERGNQSSLADLVGVLPNFSTVESGAFRQLVAAAALFGLVVVGGKEVTLTNRAYEILSDDEETRRRARLDAFLTVPLFRAIYDQQRGRALPPRIGMQRTIEQLGVVGTLAERAYGTFIRSAEQAGFFESGGRQYLVQPNLRRPSGQEPSPGSSSGAATIERAEREAPTTGGTSRPTGIHPAIMGLLQLLPPEGRPFPEASRRTWLEAVGGALDLIYGNDSGQPRNPSGIPMGVVNMTGGEEQ